MRSTSSARKAAAALLCLVLVPVPRPARAAEIPAGGPPPDPALLLMFASPEVPDGEAHARHDALAEGIRGRLRALWVSVPPPPEAVREDTPSREPDGAVLLRLAATIADAAGKMDRMETGDALDLLSEAERDARRLGAVEAVRPYVAEIFLRKGLLLLWEGNKAGAEEMFARTRAIRPDFSPDPAMFSPSFREAWSRTADRPAPGAEILIRSLPPGAVVLVNDDRRATTPSRVKVPAFVPVRIRVEYPGHHPETREGRWLPGDSEMLDLSLRPDPVARLGMILASWPAGEEEAGRLLAGVAASAGAERTALIVLSGEPERRVRVFSHRKGEVTPALVGEFAWPGGGGGGSLGARMVSDRLAGAGWPVNPEDRLKGSPWYHKWWVWALVGIAAAVAVAGAGGSGGGSGGSSTGAIGVNF